MVEEVVLAWSLMVWSTGMGEHGARSRSSYSHCTAVKKQGGMERVVQQAFSLLFSPGPQPIGW